MEEFGYLATYFRNKALYLLQNYSISLMPGKSFATQQGRCSSLIEKTVSTESNTSEGLHVPKEGMPA